jgi:multiple sugar transport system ATP-binding protein
LLNAVAGLEAPASGHVKIAGRDVTGVAPKDRDIAMVFQSYALYPSMTVRGNITFGMECRGVAQVEQRSAVEKVAKLLQIEALLDRKPAQLSGGQRQRVAMGRALVRDPVLFLFDEPLSNLDAKLRVEMRMEIKRLHQRLGTTVVYVTHDQIEAMTLATRIAVMHGGEILQFDEAQAVYDRPADLFVAGFMGSPPMNVVPVRLEVDAGVLFALAENGGESGAPAARLALPQGVAAVEAWLGKPVLLGFRPRVCCARHRGLDARARARRHDRADRRRDNGDADLRRYGNRRANGRRIAPGGRRLAEFSLDLRKACLFDPATQRRFA